MANPIGRRVRQIRYDRAAKGLPYSQVWLAEAAGVSRQTVINVENGYYMHTRDKQWVEYVPSEAIVEKLARALQVSYADIADLS